MDIDKYQQGMDELRRTRILLKELSDQLAQEVQRRTRIEQISQADMRRLHSITNSISAAIIMLNPSGAINFWNRAAEQLFGWSQQEVWGQLLHKLIIPPEAIAAHHQGFEAFRAKNSGVMAGHNRELNAMKRNGEQFPIDLTLSTVKINEEWNAIGIITDISNRKVRDQELQQHIDDLERLSQLTNGREARMIELKQEINTLLAELGRSPKYTIV